MSLTYLPLEILTKITKYLAAIDILNLSISCQQFREIVHITKFTEKISFGEIYDLPYFDSFVNIIYGLTPGREFRLPRKLKSLYWFSDELLPESFPDTLECLVMAWSYNHSLDHLPDSLIHLELSWKWNLALQRLPANLKYFKIGHFFNRPLPQLPATLEYLKLGYYFNQPLSQLPITLLVLKLGYYYNYPLPLLPKSLTHLKLNTYYRHPLPLLPDSLVNVYLYHAYQWPLPPSSNANFHLTWKSEF